MIEIVPVTDNTESEITIPAMPAHSLGGGQLCWLREKVGGFADAHDAAERAQIHAARVAADLLGKDAA